MSKLKLCPFCGSEAELYAHTLGTFSIACKATDCNYHGDKGVIDDWCSMECETPQCSTVDEAREMWNTRALPPTEGKEILDKVAGDLHLTEEEGKDLGSFMSEYFNGLSLPPTEGKEEGCEWVTLPQRLGDYIQTDCGWGTHVGMSKHEFNFCPWCGKKIKEV